MKLGNIRPSTTILTRETLFSYISATLVHHYPTAVQWRHNLRDGVSKHQSHDCLFNCLFRRRSKKTSKLRVTGLSGNSPVTGEFPAQMASNTENYSIWWRHHEIPLQLINNVGLPVGTLVNTNHIHNISKVHRRELFRACACHSDDSIQDARFWNNSMNS